MFNYQCSLFVCRSLSNARLYYHNLSYLSTTFLFLFFQTVVFLIALIYYHISLASVNTFLKFLLRISKSGERGIRTLAPLLTTYSLSRRAPSANLGISPRCPFQQKNYQVIDSFSNAEGGIRTHAPSRTNGFQDRLVMTTSIPLHNLFICVCHLFTSATRCILAHYIFNCQHLFSLFLFFIFTPG